jgi:hypothetical protein
MNPSVIDGALGWPHLAAAGSNSILAAQIAVEQTLLQKLADVSIIIVALAVIALIIVLLVTLRRVIAAQGKLMELAESVKADLTPAIANMKTLSASAVEVSASVRKTVESVDETVTTANNRLRSSVELAYQRVQQLDTLLGVAQREAEDAVISAASAVRGVKRGISALAGEPRGGRRSRRDRLVPREVVVEDDAANWDDDLDRYAARDRHGRGEPLFPEAEPGPSVHHRRSGTRNNQ